MHSNLYVKKVSSKMFQYYAVIILVKNELTGYQNYNLPI